MPYSYLDTINYETIKYLKIFVSLLDLKLMILEKKVIQNVTDLFTAEYLAV